MSKQPDRLGAVGKPRPGTVASPCPAEEQLHLLESRVFTHAADEVLLGSPRLGGLGRGGQNGHPMPLCGLGLDQPAQGMARPTGPGVNAVDNVQEVHEQAFY